MKISFITSGGAGTTDTDTWRTVTAGGNTLTGAPSGEALAFTQGTGITITESAGAVTITNDNPTDTNTNIYNTDGTLDDTRTVEFNNNSLAFQNVGVSLLSFKTGTTVQIGNAPNSYNMPLTRPTSGQVLTASNSLGAIGWATPTDTNTNIANTNLTLLANRGLALDSFELAFINGSAENILNFGGSGTTLEIGDSTSSYLMPLTRPTSGQVLTASNGTGTIGWATPTPNTNTNIANTNLTLASSRITDVAGNTLTFDSGATNIIKLDGTDDTLNIGGANPYKMPTARASAANQAIMSSDASGGMGFKSLSGNGGYCMMMSGYSGGTFTTSYYGFFKKSGGNMHIDNNLTVSASGAQQIQMFTWNGRLIPSTYKLVGQRTSSGAIGGIGTAIYFATPALANIVWTKETDFDTSFLAADSSSWQVTDGAIDGAAFSNASDGDWFTFGMVPEDDIIEGRYWLTVYFENVVI